MKYLKQRFAAREWPSAIDIAGELVAGPFCVHCGNPFSLHGPDVRCPNQHLHPLFPSPNLPYEDEAGISRTARAVLRELRGGQNRRWGTSVRRQDPTVVLELVSAGYAELRGEKLYPK